MSFFIPKKIKVGFQHQLDTYNGKLAYIIYYDKSGILKKEKSFNSWIDDSIETVEYENEPTSGFVLNKKAGDYKGDWNHRKAYWRIYDPPGCEFEIDIDNLCFSFISNIFKNNPVSFTFVFLTKTNTKQFKFV